MGCSGLSQELDLWHWLRRAIVLLTFALAALGQTHDALAETLAPNSDDEIVYFDNNRAIHVFDPRPTSPVLAVEWSSPDGRWDDFALGDVTGDGDLEIIAIRDEDDGGRLTIFDPVAQDSPRDQTQMRGGIPWAILYELELPVAPRLVATGEFDPSRPGQEILYSFALDDEHDRFVILRGTGEGGPGRGWEEQLSWDLEGRWSAVATGNVHVDDAIDEVALVSFSMGEVGLWRVEPSVVRTFTNVNRDHRWRNVALGQFVIVSNDGDELAAVRDADFPLASTWVFRYDGNSFVDQLGEVISPSPTVVFFADIGGNGDEEMILLRQVQQELGPRPRLIVRDGNNNDTIQVREELLDGDNEYKGGAAGNIDDDGGDEIVLVRNNRIRIYDDPDSSRDYRLIERFTDGRHVLLGNVDAAGLSNTSRLFVSLSSISADLQPGEVGSTRVITILDATRGTNMPFTIRLEGAEAWANVEHNDNLTPESIHVTLHAQNVQPGEYSGRLIIDVERAGVENEPVAVALSLRVARVVSASPPSVTFFYVPCTEPLEPRSREVSLSAGSALTYTAEIEGNPPWATVAPEAGVLPETVRVSVDPALRPRDIVSADLLITVDLPEREGVVNRIPVSIVCPAYQVYGPRLSK